MAGQRIGYRQGSALWTRVTSANSTFRFWVGPLATRHPPGTWQGHTFPAVRLSRDGDTVVVYSMDRLAQTWTTCAHSSRNVWSSPARTPRMANVMLSVIGAFAEFERALIKERQREGIARQRGVYRIRKKSRIRSVRRRWFGRYRRCRKVHSRRSTEAAGKGPSVRASGQELSGRTVCSKHKRPSYL